MFEWDEHNLSHIASHRISFQEIEQVIENNPFDIESTFRHGETRTLSIGETNRGRILVVVTTARAERIRVVTAYPAKKRLREFYLREKRKAKNEGS